MIINRHLGLKSVLIVMISIGFIIACTNDNNRKPEKIISQDELYFDYRIWGDEESGTITITLQFRLGDEDRTPVALPSSAKVELDGEVLDPDSSKRNGIYYEAIRTVEDFSGTHSIVVHDFLGMRYKEEFDFSPISLTTELPDIVYRDDLVFELQGLDTTDYVHVILMDTSFYSRGIDRVDTVLNGHVAITRQDLDQLKNGPIFLEFYKEEDWPLKESAALGGRITISYGINRSFELKDNEE